MLVNAMTVVLVQVAEAENVGASLSDESEPEDIEPKLLRKQLLEVSLGNFLLSLSFSFCFTTFTMPSVL